MLEAYKEDDFICDDRGVLDNIQKIRSMSDEEFEKYIAELKRQETEKKQ